MSFYKVLPLLFLIFTIASCQSSSEKEDANLNQSAQLDSHTQSNYSEISLNHLDLKLDINFNDKYIDGIATWHIDSFSDSKVLILDTRDLIIDSVILNNDQHTKFRLGDTDPILGTPLIIDLLDHTQSVSVYYKTGQNATALQWLTPTQTFGKNAPFLYTQSQSIYARSWIPSPDGPGIRFTYDAKVKVPQGLLALMSASNPQQKSADGIYHFQMDKPIPAYLLALAVGDLEYRDIDSRSGVYAEKQIIEKAHKEFEDVGEMISIAENIYGPYRWGRYDLIVLPPGFPYGGMENPILTFLTPTILAGDKSLLNLVAHELAHSWSGNLVTNESWNDFWINEGFTVYFERRITEAIHGKEYAAMLWELGLQDLNETLEHIEPRDSWLKLDLQGKSPDIGLTDIAYEKGAFFLKLIEETVGREQFDTFLKGYFDTHAFQTMTTEKFLDYLQENLLDTDPNFENIIKINDWVYGPGLPNNIPLPIHNRFKNVDSQLNAFQQNKIQAKEIDVTDWSTYEYLHFLRNLSYPIEHSKMEDLDHRFNLTQSQNNEILNIWYLQAIRSNYDEAFPAMKHFLYEIGRRKFLEPLYSALSETPAGKKMAKDIYKIARPNYHPLAQGTIDDLLYPE